MQFWVKTYQRLALLGNNTWYIRTHNIRNNTTNTRFRHGSHFNHEDRFVRIFPFVMWNCWSKVLLKVWKLRKNKLWRKYGNQQIKTTKNCEMNTQWLLAKGSEVLMLLVYGFQIPAFNTCRRFCFFSHNFTAFVLFVAIIFQKIFFVSVFFSITQKV